MQWITFTLHSRVSVLKLFLPKYHQSSLLFSQSHQQTCHSPILNDNNKVVLRIISVSFLSSNSVVKFLSKFFYIYCFQFLTSHPLRKPFGSPLLHWNGLLMNNVRKIIWPLWVSVSSLVNLKLDFLFRRVVGGFSMNVLFVFNCLRTQTFQSLL